MYCFTSHLCALGPPTRATIVSQAALAGVRAGVVSDTEGDPRLRPAPGTTPPVRVSKARVMMYREGDADRKRMGSDGRAKSRGYGFVEFTEHVHVRCKRVCVAPANLLTTAPSTTHPPPGLGSTANSEQQPTVYGCGSRRQSGTSPLSIIGMAPQPQILLFSRTHTASQNTKKTDPAEQPRLIVEFALENTVRQVFVLCGAPPTLHSRRCCTDKVEATREAPGASCTEATAHRQCYRHQRSPRWPQKAARCKLREHREPGEPEQGETKVRRQGTPQGKAQAKRLCGRQHPSHC